MEKITNKNYSIPIIEALSPHNSFATGANKPFLISGVDINGNKGDYVVKFLAAGRMSTEAFQREPLAAFIAMEM
jgi:hypothetical protein